jgi:hypothetical protein
MLLWVSILCNTLTFLYLLHARRELIQAKDELRRLAGKTEVLLKLTGVTNNTVENKLQHIESLLTYRH